MIEPGDIQTLVRELEAQGWKVENTSHSHHKATPPDPTATIVHFKRSGTPGSWKNTLADLRRSGFRLEEVGKKRVGNGSRVHPRIRCPACGECTFDVERGTCVGKCDGPVEESLMVAAASAALRAAQRPTLETAFQNLRDAKDLHGLASEETKRAQADYMRAAERLDECRRAESQTEEDLKKRKEEFDVALGS